MDWYKFLSRKFILAVFVMILVSCLPVIFKDKGIADIVTMAVIGIIGGIATAYKISNVKEAAIQSVEIKPSVSP